MILAIYGLVFFLLLNFYNDVPRQYLPFYDNLYTFIEYFSFATIFYLILNKKSYKKVILILSSFFIVFEIAHFLFIKNIRTDSIAIGVESILIFIYIFLFFTESLDNPKNEFIYSHYGFWISIGLLIYLGGSFFINLLANSLSQEEFLKYWYLNYIADTVKTLFFAIGLLMLITKRKNREILKHSSIPHLDMI